MRATFSTPVRVAVVCVTVHGRHFTNQLEVLSFTFLEFPATGGGGIVRQDLYLLVQSWRYPEEEDNPDLLEELASSGHMLAHQCPGFPQLWQLPFIAGLSVPKSGTESSSEPQLK
jgi:hypothetical protein